MAQGLEKARDPVAALGRADEHRHHMALLELPREVVEHQVPRGLDLGDQVLHQFVVVVGEALEHGVAGLALADVLPVRQVHHLARGMLAVDEGALQGEIDEAHRDAVPPDRDLAQEERRARGALQQGQGLADAPGRSVDLVDEEEAGHAGLLQLPQGHFEGRDLALVRLAHHHRRVAGGHDVAHLVQEFRRAGAIDEGHGVAEEIHRGHVGLDAHAVGAGLRAAVAHAVAVGDPARPGNRAGPLQDRLQESGLAALEWADDGNASRAPRSSAVGCHESLLPLPP
jgi:hypothetical protein